MNTFNLRVYNIIRRIPEGKVLNYGTIARLAGNPSAARAVGYAMHAIRPEDNLPWHRVVFKDGGMAFMLSGQKNMLEQEGVLFTPEGKVDLESCLWDALEIEAEVSGLQL